ncbi:MAG: hypothetical protein KDK65_01915, partial [Chlamydiia bacterium]|nr:hypothetical protein [Chlamydiia bacterium]
GLPIDVEEGEKKLFGWISPPSHHRPNRTGQYLIVNGRPICSHPFSYAIKEGYSTSLPSNRFPLFVLHLTLPPNQIDVNVHPQKKEVRLAQEWPLKQWVAQAIQSALTPKQQQKPTFNYTPTYTPPPRMVQEEMHIPYQTILPTFRALKTVKGYIFVEGFLDAVPDTSLHLLNQTLAEKALLDHQLKDPEPFEREQLLIPITFTVTPQESLLIEEHHDTLHRLGLEIRLFGTNTFLVDAHSHHWEGKDVKGEILTLLETPKTAVKTFTNRQTPSPRRLTTTEAQALIDQLTRKEIPFEPPLLISLTPEQCQKLSSTL